MAPVTDDLTALAPLLRECFLRASYDTDSLLGLLGTDAHRALTRGEPVPVRRASVDGGRLGTLVRLLLLVDDCAESEVRAALDPVPLERAVAAGLLERDGDRVRAALDVRPMDAGTGTRWMISDLDGGMRARTTEPDHVLGVGHASLSLLSATPTAPVGSVLDIGTGCGVQAVRATDYARQVTATDVNARALALTSAGCALNDVDVELRRGPWFDPVAGREFDQIVANPPFVVGGSGVDHTYRDSGLTLDGASELMIGRAPQHLTPGGTAAMLASWVHVQGQDWRERVSSWLPDHGVEAWVVQRDVADPALYVGTWMRDGGLDPRDRTVAGQAEAWLDTFAAERVEGVGFGFVYLRRTDESTGLLAEDLRHGFDDPLGAEALDYLHRIAWLREHDLMDSRFTLAPATALERVSLPSAPEPGWREVVARVHRGDGPRWQHEVDDLAVSLLSGLCAEGLPLGELVSLLAFAHELPEAELTVRAVELIDGLVRHGLVRPAGPGS
ncbi:methyltransferase [Speluncibacter jeojiensis]|uniref:DUF7782 domain-containing protein n=1 Tax=Speluncibacter jeojiensis TaxID=2710754 RepID=UPI0039F5C261